MNFKKEITLKENCIKSYFDFIDKDQSGKIDFDEFIRVLGTYCMFTKDDIMRYVGDV